MPYDYEILPKAQQHLEDSIVWYSEQSLELAEDFANDLKSGIAKICSDQIVTRRKYKRFSHFLLSKFPFTIIYIVNGPKNLISIRSIYHQKRNPHKKYR